MERCSSCSTTSLAVLLACVVSAPSAWARAWTADQPVSTNAGAARTTCGITAASALEFKRKVEGSGLTRIDAGPRFDAFISAEGDDMVQWAITRAGEPGYPAVTCRHIYKAADGAWLQDRNMRCDADRAACDAPFAEFKQLDEQARAAIAAQVGH